MRFNPIIYVQLEGWNGPCITGQCYAIHWHDITLLTVWSCFHSINRRNRNSSVLRQRKSNEVRNKIHTSHQTRAGTIPRLYIMWGMKDWWARVFQSTRACAGFAAAALLLLLCISFSQISSIQLGRIWAASGRTLEWGFASGHTWNCIWKHWKATLEIGNTNMHVTLGALGHVASKVCLKESRRISGSNRWSLQE